MALKFIVIFLVISTSVSKIDSANPLAIIGAEDESHLCLKKTRIFWKFAWKYFEDRYAVRVIASKSASTDFTSQILKCSMKVMKLSLQYNCSEWYHAAQYPRRRLANEQQDLYYHHEVNGLIFISESAEKIKMILPIIDPQTRTIIMLMNSTAEDIKEVLTSAWSQNSILNLVVFNNMKIINKKQREILQLHASVYDPFVIKNDSRGFIYTFEMNDEVYLIKLLDILKTRLINVHGYPLRACFRLGSKSLLANRESLSSAMMKTMIETINFDMMNFLGCNWTNIHMMDEGHIDLTTFTRAMSYGLFNHSEFLFPLNRMAFGFVKAKTQLGVMMSFIKIFTPGAFITLATTYVTMAFVWKWFQKLHHTFKKSRSRKLDFMEISCITFGNFLLVSQPSSKRCYERCLFIGWIFFSMIICYTYQGSMVKYLAFSNTYKYVKTVDELIKIDSKILVPDQFLMYATEVALDKNTPDCFRRILKYASSEKDMKSALLTLTRIPNTAMLFYFPSYYLFIFKYQSYHKAYVVEERLYDNYHSFVVPIDSPYKERFEQILMIFLESGLMSKWLQNHEFNYRSSYPVPNEPVPSDDIYKMKDFSFIFWSWLGSCSFCCLMFLVEYLWPHIFKKKLKKLR